ncbi:hypothetical protein AK830_g11309 [Neonectria ditissima]|uniref:PD-(D/E)XK nuclease-like domain-containing protein n=1 Tax=Neonectria ditissima TaxID=78410 RepID=A0A0P7B3F2_9HYPO|nr:hypothetical protein AK830_g11309 [Neonectria ditissima]
MSNTARAVVLWLSAVPHPEDCHYDRNGFCSSKAAYERRPKRALTDDSEDGGSHHGKRRHRRSLPTAAEQRLFPALSSSDPEQAALSEETEQSLTNLGLESSLQDTNYYSQEGALNVQLALHPPAPASVADTSASAKREAEVGLVPDATSSPVRSNLSQGPRTEMSREKYISLFMLRKFGFQKANFSEDSHPDSLRALHSDLKSISDGAGFLPRQFKSRLNYLQFPETFFSQPFAATQAVRMPPQHLVRRILREANTCVVEKKNDLAWNTEIHHKVLDWLLRQGENEITDAHSREGTLQDVSRLDFEFCPRIEPSPLYRSQDVSNGTVDFCLPIRPSSNEQTVVDAICQSRPAQSINHTAYGTLRRHPIALSIKSQTSGQTYQSELAQLVAWHSTQWRSLRWAGRNVPRIQFLPGIMVAGHDWRFVATTMDRDGITTIFGPPLALGNTRTEQGFYKLVVALQRLQRWAMSDLWPAFKYDMLGIM